MCHRWQSQWSKIHQQLPEVAQEQQSLHNKVVAELDLTAVKQLVYLASHLLDHLDQQLLSQNDQVKGVLGKTHQSGPMCQHT